MATALPLRTPLALLESAGFLVGPFPLFVPAGTAQGWVALRVSEEWTDSVVLRGSEAATATRVSASVLDRGDVAQQSAAARHVTGDALGVVYEVLGWPLTALHNALHSSGDRVPAGDRVTVARRSR